MIFANALFALICVVCVLLLAKYYVHMLQLEGYFITQYLPHLFRRVRNPLLLFRKQVAKKPLVFTARVKRLYFCIFVIAAVLALGIFLLAARLAVLAVLYILPAVLTSLIVLAASATMSPIEKSVAAWYVKDASRILKAHPDLKIIAITGSYGKTSTKFILSTILSEKFACLTPPSSYNTTMGVVRVIRERLQPDDEIFICEMGSRHIGDIKEICDFVHPHHAIITSIGPQHLDTFGSIDGVKKGKFELVEALKPDGLAVFASSNEHILDLYSRATGRKATAGFLTSDSLRAENISVGCTGSTFTLIDENGDSIECVTRLLGKHNISNILVGARMALEMGMTLKEVARGISRIKPVEHRLQIVNQAPVTVIDDAFNSSPNGAAAALEVLGGFEGRRIIVTPGFVELGAEEDRYHFELGTRIKENADVCILVGKKRTEKIKEGLEGFLGEVYQVSSLNEATALLNKIAVAGDVVLFENDLPDNFNE